uniref:Uncharacterized protein n=1 Tax=Homalodisca liturata TaxID=320908 RepID=A0A1B6I374_9HEMI
MKSSPSVHVTKLNKHWLTYWPSSRSNIWQRSIQANPLKWYKKKKKNFDPTLFKMNTGAHTLRLDAGTEALAGRGPSMFVSGCYHWADSPHHSVDGTHGDPVESQHNQ